jgi:hypothetical protein
MDMVDGMILVLCDTVDSEIDSVRRWYHYYRYLVLGGMRCFVVLPCEK